jgi:hydroxyacid-oxoacid transhydrogenase
MGRETAFSMDTSSILFGPGVTRELGEHVRQRGVTRVLLVTDRQLVAGAAVAAACASLRAAGVSPEIFDGVVVEPTDVSLTEAIAVARAGGYAGYVAVGGGSTIDTTKVAALYARYPAPLRTYVNPPIGAGQPVPGPLPPIFAVPTTAGTGSETTGVAIFDDLTLHAKTGIAHRALRPVLGLLDPDHTRSQPPMVAACSGLDVVCHALESLTALPYHQRVAPEHPGARPSYQGANPISDVWSAHAITLATRYLLRAIEDPSDDEARAAMLQASAFAGIGFGNAGVHLAHGMSYPVSGMVRAFHAPGYPSARPLVPHGMSVILNAPAVFRFTAPADPERHLRAAALLGADTRGAAAEDAGELIATTLIALIRRIGLPNGLEALGYGEADLDALVAGTLPQHRVTRLSPRPASADDLRQLFRQSLRLW